jgi:hypothetical protein
MRPAVRQAPDAHAPLPRLLPWGVFYLFDGLVEIHHLGSFLNVDHHGGGCDWTFETNKFIRLRLRARSPKRRGC